MTKSTIEFTSLDMFGLLEPVWCTSYGRFDAINYSKFFNCPGWCPDYINNNISEKIFLDYRLCYNSSMSVSVTFRAYGDECERVPCEYNPDMRYACCGNLIGSYQTLSDGTIFCSYGGTNAWATFGSDKYNIEVVSAKTIFLKGGWRYNTSGYEYEYDCQKAIEDPQYYSGTITETVGYTLGTMTISGV